MSTTSETKITSELPDGWQQAKKYASVLGLVPSSFSIAIRTMISDHLKNDASLRPVTKYHVCRLMNGPSFKSMLYFASMDLRSGYLKDQKAINVGSMVDLFEPFDLAVMVGSYLIFRKWRKFIGKEEWNWLVSQFTEESQIGAQLGAAIPELGIGAGIMISTMPGLALGTVLKHDQKMVQKYMHTRAKTGWSEKTQLECFGCTLNQITTHILCSMGFSTEIVNSYTSAMDPSRFFNAEDKGLLPRMQMARYWVEALLAGKTQPLHKIPGKFFPMETAKKLLETKIVDIKANSPHWLTRGKADIDPTKTPALFAKAESTNQEVPDELKQVFSMDEIAKMELEDFDQLIDQLDYENGGKPPPGMVVMSTKELKDLEGMVE